MKLLGGIFLVRVHIQDGQANLQQISSLHLLDSNNVLYFSLKTVYTVDLVKTSPNLLFFQCLYLSPEHHPVFPWLQFDPSRVSQ